MNREIAKIFQEIADFLEMEKSAFKPQAYQKAALILESLKEDIKDIYEKGGKRALLDIPGIGESMADKIEEHIKIGKIKYYEDLKKKTPININELIRVEGLGPQKVKALYEKLEIRSIEDLEKAAKAQKIAPLFGFGEKTEKNILEAIEFLKRDKGRFLLGDILPQIREIEQKLKNLKEVEKIAFAGSLRRMKETIGDADLLIASKNPEKIMDFFVSLPGVIKVWGKGKTKSSIRMKDGFDIDLRVVPSRSYGAALQYFTGSKEHNIAIRRIAIEKGLKLSEYGLFRGSKFIVGNTEEEIYKSLDMQWILPELRENQGEIDAALAKNIPEIISQKNIKGDLHCHSSWDGGKNTILEMAQAAKDMSYEYIGIADHTKFLRIEQGLDENDLAIQRKEIDKLNNEFRVSGYKFRVLQGCESNIMPNGSIDIKDEALKKLDFVIAGIHSSFKIEKEKMTERLIKAMKNPHVDIISHPTGRLIKRRSEYQIDFEKILRAAKEFNVILEINSSPERLDLNDQNIKRAKKEGVKMIINTDSHHKDQMRLMEFGVAQARRGWAEKQDIVNTQPLEELLKLFR